MVAILNAFSIRRQKARHALTCEEKLNGSVKTQTVEKRWAVILEDMVGVGLVTVGLPNLYYCHVSHDPDSGARRYFLQGDVDNVISKE